MCKAIALNYFVLVFKYLNIVGSETEKFDHLDQSDFCFVSDFPLFALIT